MAPAAVFLPELVWETSVKWIIIQIIILNITGVMSQCNMISWFLRFDKRKPWSSFPQHWEHLHILVVLRKHQQVTSGFRKLLQQIWQFDRILHLGFDLRRVQMSVNLWPEPVGRLQMNPQFGLDLHVLMLRWWDSSAVWTSSTITHSD